MGPHGIDEGATAVHPDRVRVLLVGLMATGKSTVGRAVAARLGCRYLDNDELVLTATGSALDDLLRRDGEAGLRAAESAALTAALAAPAPVVAGVAAGVVLDPADRMRLREADDAFVVWLRARPQTLAARVAAAAARSDPGSGNPGSGNPVGVVRPWLRPDPLAAFTRMAAERAGWYEEVADLVVDIDTAVDTDTAIDVDVDVAVAQADPDTLAALVTTRLLDR